MYMFYGQNFKVQKRLGPLYNSVCEHLKPLKILYGTKVCTTSIMEFANLEKLENFLRSVHDPYRFSWILKKLEIFLRH